MERVIVIEVLDEQGKTLERLKATKFPFRIGRAYDNDLIVDDPYVCPHHCEVVSDEAGEIHVNDLASINGTYQLGKQAPFGRLGVTADSQLRIGHTTLRFRLPGQAVEATLHDHVPYRQRHEWWPPRTFSINLALLVIAALIMALSNYLDSYDEFEFGRYFLREQIPALTAVAVWAGIWAIVSRLTAHRFDYFRHAAILVSILLAVYLSDYLIEFMKFGLASQWPFDLLSWGISAGAIALLLFWHLRLCSAQKPRRLLLVSSLIAMVLVGLVQFNDYLDGKEFRSNPLYSTVLKPPVFQMVESKSVDDFLVTAVALREEIDTELATQRATDERQPASDSRPE